MQIDIIGQVGQTIAKGAMARVTLDGANMTQDLEALDRLATAEGASRVLRPDERVYLLMPAGRERRPPCGACGSRSAIGQVCHCQEKPKLAASEHVTERCDPRVRARLGLP